MTERMVPNIVAFPRVCAPGPWTETTEIRNPKPKLMRPILANRHPHLHPVALHVPSPFHSGARELVLRRIFGGCFRRCSAGGHQVSPQISANLRKSDPAYQTCMCRKSLANVLPIQILGRMARRVESLEWRQVPSLVAKLQTGEEGVCHRSPKVPIPKPLTPIPQTYTPKPQSPQS